MRRIIDLFAAKNAASLHANLRIGIDSQQSLTEGCGEISSS